MSNRQLWMAAPSRASPAAIFLAMVVAGFGVLLVFSGVFFRRFRKYRFQWTIAALVVVGGLLGGGWTVLKRGFSATPVRIVVLEYERLLRDPESRSYGGHPQATLRLIHADSVEIR